MPGVNWFGRIKPIVDSAVSDTSGYDSHLLDVQLLPGDQGSYMR